jgi:hypothetical protein
MPANALACSTRAPHIEHRQIEPDRAQASTERSLVAAPNAAHNGRAVVLPLPATSRAEPKTRSCTRSSPSTWTSSSTMRRRATRSRYHLTSSPSCATTSPAGSSTEVSSAAAAMAAERSCWCLMLADLEAPVPPGPRDECATRRRTWWIECCPICLCANGSQRSRTSFAPSLLQEADPGRVRPRRLPGRRVPERRIGRR